MKKIILTEAGERHLGQLAQAGAVQATTAFSDLIKQAITVKAVKARVIPQNEIANLVLDSSKSAVLITMGVRGDIEGQALFFYPKQSAMNVADILGKKSIGSSSTINPDDISALKESGNIIVGSFMSAFSDYTKVNMIESTPEIFQGSFMEVVRDALPDFSHGQEVEAIVFEVHAQLATQAKTAETVVPEIKIESFFVLVLDISSMKTVFAALADKAKSSDLLYKEVVSK
jgi:chemotaxis protein CheC